MLTFFVISGFLITHLLLRENKGTGTVSLSRFYARRSLRIFPAFYVYWIIAVVDMILRHRNVWTRDLCAFFYVNNYYQGLHGYPYSLLGHTWSLSVEEQFYLLWPGIFYLCRKHLPRLRILLLCTIPAIWTLRLFLHFHAPETYIYKAFETRVDALLCDVCCRLQTTPAPSTGCCVACSRSGSLPASSCCLLSRLALRFAWAQGTEILLDSLSTRRLWRC